MAAYYGAPSAGVGIVANSKCDKMNKEHVSNIHLLLIPVLSTNIPINGEIIAIIFL